MSHVLFNYNTWEFWDTYNAANSVYGNQKVTFDGINRLILVNFGEDDLDARVDLYSNWKEWVTVDDNARFPLAITAVGGDPITESQSVGITYFLENGWRIKPYSGNHILRVAGNVYTREPGQDPFVDVDGNFKVTVSTTRSNLVDFVEIPVSSLNPLDQAKLDELHKLQGLNRNAPLEVEGNRRSAGEDIVQTISDDGLGKVTVTRDLNI